MEEAPESTDPTARLLETASWCWSYPGKTVPRVRVEDCPAIDFHRKFVSRNAPCILLGLQRDWNPPPTWEAFVEAAGGPGAPVQVNVTPYGKGDHIETQPDGRKLFVRPESREMRLGDFMTWLRTPDAAASSSKGSVMYLSQQNDCLRTDFDALLRAGMVPGGSSFGEEVFGKPCDAANLWLGDGRAISCVHRDSSYENLYGVAKGTKVFHLLPPPCILFMNEQQYPNATYRQEKDGSWVVDEDEAKDTTPWIELDPSDPEKAVKTFPDFRKVQHLVMRVEVRAGETLYLPAGWLHRVTQTEPTLAFNYWFDRDFNALWALQDAVEGMAKRSGV